MARRKLKPNKSVMSRFKVTKTGKLKRHRAKTSHLMSGRRPKARRQLGRAAVLSETLARNMRRLMGLSRKRRVKAARQPAATAPARQQQPQPAPQPAQPAGGETQPTAV